MTEIYIDKADLNMYQLKPAPPKWDLQEYIVTCLKEKDNSYLAWFLHYYEKTLNNNVQEYMRKLFMPEHFANMKQAYIAGLLKALKNYDIEQGAPFTSFKERYAEREILDYVRPCVQASQHKALRNMPSSVKQWQYGTNTSVIIQMKH